MGVGSGVIRVLVLCAVAGLLAACGVRRDPPIRPIDAPPVKLRVATFNVALSRDAPGAMLAMLQNRDATQPRAIAEIIQRVRPDVLLLNEFDYDEQGVALHAFQSNFLAVSQNGEKPLVFPYAFLGPVNTGLPTGRDLDKDGDATGPGDAYGFGKHPGHYGMAVLSQFPISGRSVRTFQRFLWARMPGNRLPLDYYGEDARILRLSSKSHWDIPIRVGQTRFHLIASHPTPPVFDGDEDRNGRRNADEIRFLRDYVTPGADGWIVDDVGRAGGLGPDKPFVILGDLNADPMDGDQTDNAIQQVLRSERLLDPRPMSAGGRFAAGQAAANAGHRGDSALDTADLKDDPGPGNLRLDYVLPSTKPWRVLDAGVFWPVPGEPGEYLVDALGKISSDHRLVWVDLLID